MIRSEIRWFHVFPSVVKAGEVSEITIAPHHNMFQTPLEPGRAGDYVVNPDGKEYRFPEDEYEVKIAPKEKREHPRNIENGGKHPFTRISVKQQDGKITFSHFFEAEQEYKFIFFSKNGTRRYEFSVYALEEDLYNTLPYKGDLHLHTENSDGRGTLCETVSAFRSYGFDFICLTDHMRYKPSVAARDMFADVNTGLTVFPGEEVHNRYYGYFHIVNFNGSYSVNEALDRDYDNILKEIEAKAKEMDLPADVDAYEYAYRKWISDEIRKSGGKAILPHPYWSICDEYHTCTAMSFYCLKSGIYDILEVVGGPDGREENHGTDLQIAMYNELRAEGFDIPIVGSTDVHTFEKNETSLLDRRGTIVFARDKDDIVDAIMDKRAVAWEHLPGEKYRAFGHFRLVKYALFLLDNFYPIYQIYTHDVGALMRAYRAYGDCKVSLEGLNEKAETFKKKFFGR